MSDPIPGHSRFRGGEAGQAYNEAAFRYFLAVDRVRAQRSARPLYLVLVTIRASLGRAAALPDTTAALLFRGLGAAVREVDFVGWYRERHVAAAVLVQGGKTPEASVTRAIASRVLTHLARRLPAESPRLRVRVVRLGGARGGTET